MLTFKTRASRPSSKALDDLLGFTGLDFLRQSSQRTSGPLKIYQETSTGWQLHRFDHLTKRVGLTAAGLVELGLEAGDRVGFLIQSDVSFLTLDMACVQSNLVSVPIDLSQTIENIIDSLDHSDAKVLFVKNPAILNQVLPYLNQAQSLKWLIVLKGLGNQSWQESCGLKPPILTHDRSTHDRSTHEPSPQGYSPIPASAGLVLSNPMPTPDLNTPSPCPFRVMAWETLLETGKDALDKEPEMLNRLDLGRSPQDLATLIYIPREDGKLRGVMLSHENLTSTALAAFAGIKKLRWGDRETVLTFLPLTHIFARVMLYGHLYYGHTLYFSSPKRVMKHLQDVRPTILATVPILMHRVFRRLQTYGQNPSRSTPTGHPSRRWRFAIDAVKTRGHHWAMAIALRSKPASPWSFKETVEQRLASMIYRQWRGIFGGRLRYCLTGGAALDPATAQFFITIGLPLYQGYGLTQTSSAVTFNRPGHNVPGTVGQVRVGADCVIGTDGEVLVKGTGVMQGYFKSPAETALAIDQQGWFHTGDLGYLDPQKHLTLVGRKKALFKLTTGKYVTPLPLEKALERSPLVAHALVVGDNSKYCGALLFVEERELLKAAQNMGLTQYSLDTLINNACMVAVYQGLVEEANCYFPYWSTIKRIQLLLASAYPSHLNTSRDSGARARLIQRFAGVINDLYQTDHPPSKPNFSTSPPKCQEVPVVSCPIAGQSLKTKLS